jgi:hypothetical protein
MRVSRRLACVVAVALLPACNGYEKVAETPPVRSATVPGALPPSARDSTGTGLYDFMQTVNWTAKTTVHMCTNSLLCFFGQSPKVDVDLEVPSGSYAVDPRAIPADGVILVRVLNHGPGSPGHYKFKAGLTYAITVYPDSQGATTSHWVLEEIDSNHVAHRVPDIHGPFTPCWDAPPATTDRVYLYKCGEAHRSPGVERSGLGLFGVFEHLMAEEFQLRSEGPIWKSCPAGCCTLAEG